MDNTVIKVENLSKQYRLGEVGTGTISHDLNRWWHRIMGKEDPYLRIGESNDRSKKGNSEYVWALQDINFEVQQGEVLGIIGKNGAGKSTLLKILSKVTAPTTGSIKARGRIAALLEVGTGFHPELTGRENIYLNGTILGMTKLEVTAKLDEIVDFSGVERYLDTPVKRYSSGMMVRLGFAVAAHLEPEILIVDEVLAVGDAEFQNKAIGKMQEVSSRGGRTVLFVSHNMASIKKLCTKILLLENGSIALHGSVEEGIKEYLRSTISDQSNLHLFDILGNNSIDELVVWEKIETFQSNNQTLEFNNDESFEFNIEFRLKKNSIGFRLLVSLENSDGICILKSFFDESNNWGSSMNSGYYKANITFPPDLLIEGKYTLKILATLHNIRMIKPVSGIPVYFDVFQTGAISRKQFSDDFKGLITLPFLWRVTNINDEGNK